MITSSFNISVARDGSYIRLKNTSIIPGGTVVEVSKITISRPGKEDYICNLLSTGKHATSLTTDGVKLYPSDFSATSGIALVARFEDGYYMVTLTEKEQEQEEVSATVNEGFSSTVEEALNLKVVALLGVDGYDRSIKAKAYSVAQAIIRSARADARVGLVESYDAKIGHVYRIFSEEGN